MYRKLQNIYMRKQYCQACIFARNGIKIGKSIDHTCSEGRYTGPTAPKFNWVPTRQELDMYLERLAELMEEDEKDNLQVKE